MKGDSHPTDPHLRFFPFSRFKKGQPQIADTVYRGAKNNEAVLIEAPMGSGKTAATLSGLLGGKKQKQVIFWAGQAHPVYVNVFRDLLRINANLSGSRQGFIGTEFIGKPNMCVNPELRGLQGSDFYETCKQKKKYEDCSYYLATLEYNEEFASYSLTKGASNRLKAIKRNFRKGRLFRLAGDYGFAKYLRDNFVEEFCAYEMMIDLAKEADLIAGDYFYIITDTALFFFPRTKLDISQCHLVIDEADRFLQRATDLMTRKLTEYILARFSKKCERARDYHQSDSDSYKVLNGHFTLFQRFWKTIEKFATECQKRAAQLRTKELELKKRDLIEFFFQKTRWSIEKWQTKLEEVSKDVLEMGPDEQLSSSIMRFLSNWLEAEEDKFVLLYDRTGSYLYQFRIIPLDIVDIPLYRRGEQLVTLTDVLTSFESVTFISATLYPEYFARRLQLDRHRIYRQAEFFIKPEAYRVIIATHLDSIYGKKGKRRDTIRPSYYQNILTCHNLAPEGNTLVFTVSNHEKALYKEEFSDLSVEERIIHIECVRGAASRGSDFPGFTTAFIAGYPEVAPSLIHNKRKAYFRRKFGKDSEILILGDKISEAIQAAGRIFRSEDACGIVIFGDKRFENPALLPIFPPYFRNNLRVAHNEDELREEVNSFWDAQIGFD